MSFIDPLPAEEPGPAFTGVTTEDTDTITFSGAGTEADPLSADAQSGSSVAFKRTFYRHSANYTTTSTTFVDIDATNLPALSLTLAVGDVVELNMETTCYNTADGNIVGFDWLIDQPTSADTTIRAITGEFAAAWYTQRQGSYETKFTARRTFVATEAGTHSFKLQWRVGGGTGTIPCNGATYKVGVEHIIRNLGPVTA